MLKLEKLEELYKINEHTADHTYGSAFYYGNLTEEEWKTILTRLLNQATFNGYFLGKGFVMIDETEEYRKFLDKENN